MQVISLLFIFNELASVMNLYLMNFLYLLIFIPLFYYVVLILLIEARLFLTNFSLIDSLIIQLLVNIFLKVLFVNLIEFTIY